MTIKSTVDMAAANDLIVCWQESPYPSIKTTSYFPVYAQLFAHLRGTACTFVETGILDGGSLFMWRRWLGEKARIVGIDLNPGAKKWEAHGFEIHIGDQGDPDFWNSVLPAIGNIDAFLDDGGHQSFQQIVTVRSLIRQIQNDCIVAVEDTYTSFMNDFSSHGRNSFLEYAKDSTDCIVGRSFSLYPNRFPSKFNNEQVDLFSSVFGVLFFNGVVAFQISPTYSIPPQIIRNKSERQAADYRHEGKNSARIDWPNILHEEHVTILGGTS